MSRLPRTTRLAALAERFDVFLVDQFGTLHDGTRVYDGALDALRRLRAAGRRVALLSNSGRRAAPNAARLARLGIPPDAYEVFVTSGEVAWRMLAGGEVRAAASARTCLVLSRGALDAEIASLGLQNVARAEAADLVIIAGSEADTRSLDSYADALRPAASRGVPALCLNPDRTMLTPSGLAPGAGRIAELYAAMGGNVTWIGKPHREIYGHALAALGVPQGARVVGIGDSVEHDIAGAQAIGGAGALVRMGILDGADDDAVRAECARVGAWPDALLPRFAWD